MIISSMTGLAAVRLAWGGLLVTMPGSFYAVTRGHAERPAQRHAAGPAQRWVLRVLGARHLLLGLAMEVRPTRGVVAWAGLADVLHVASCAGAVMISSEWRRPALVDGVVEAGLAVADLRWIRSGYGKAARGKGPA